MLHAAAAVGRAFAGLAARLALALRCVALRCAALPCGSLAVPLLVVLKKADRPRIPPPLFSLLPAYILYLRSPSLALAAITAFIPHPNPKPPNPQNNIMSSIQTVTITLTITPATPRKEVVHRRSARMQNDDLHLPVPCPLLAAKVHQHKRMVEEAAKASEARREARREKRRAERLAKRTKAELVADRESLKVLETATNKVEVVEDARHKLAKILEAQEATKRKLVDEMLAAVAEETAELKALAEKREANKLAAGKLAADLTAFANAEVERQQASRKERGELARQDATRKERVAVKLAAFLAENEERSKAAWKVKAEEQMIFFKNFIKSAKRQ